MTEPKLTARQEEVLAIVAEFPKGVAASQVRDRIYPADSPMRTKRCGGGNGSNRCGQVGGLGNLAAGRILTALERKGVAHQGREYNGEQDNRYYLGAF